MISSYHIDYYCFHVEQEPVILYPEPEPRMRPRLESQLTVSPCQKYSYAAAFMALSLTNAALTGIVQNAFSKGLHTPLELSKAQQLYVILSVISLVQGSYVMLSKSPCIILSARINLIINGILQTVALGLLISKN